MDKEFIKLLGSLEFKTKLGIDSSFLEKPELEWKALPETTNELIYDEDIKIPADREQPGPLKVNILFESGLDGIYDVGWVAAEGTQLQSGDDVIRAYRTTDGTSYVQKVPFSVKVVKSLVVRNQKVVRGDGIVLCTITSLSLDLHAIRNEMRSIQMELAQAVNASVKGYMSYIGEGGQVAKNVEPVHAELQPEKGYVALLNQIVVVLKKENLKSGDILVISEKIISTAQGRLFPLELLYSEDPKMTDLDGRMDLTKKVKEFVPDITSQDLLCSDSLLTWPEGAMATAGVSDPNTVAYEIAKLVHDELGITCDVVVSDTDTGLDVRETLIGCITIGASPLGATAGLVIYECMRVANAAEFARGSSRGIPIVVCHPHERRTVRNSMGEHRGYNGRLNASKECLLGFA